MAARFAFVFIASLVVFQALTWSTDATAIRVARETPTAKPETDASKTIDDAINSLKTGFDDLVKNVQGNELLQNVTASIKQFGESVKDQGKQLVEKFENASNANKQ